MRMDRADSGSGVSDGGYSFVERASSSGGSSEMEEIGYHARVSEDGVLVRAPRLDATASERQPDVATPLLVSGRDDEEGEGLMGKGRGLRV